MRRIRTPSKIYFLRIFIGKKVIEIDFVSKSDVLAISDALRFVRRLVLNKSKIGFDKFTITKIVVGDNFIFQIDKKGYCDSIKTDEFFIWTRKRRIYTLEDLFRKYIKRT